MNFNFLKCPLYFVGNSIFYPAAKVILIIFLLTGVWRTQAVMAVDFKTYLEGVRVEIKNHKNIIQEDPLDAVAYFELGRSYLALGKHEEEVNAYIEAIELYPKYTLAHYNLAMAYDLLKDGPNAIKHMLRALDQYSGKRNHVQIRNVQRQLKRLYLKYQISTSTSKTLN